MKQNFIETLIGAVVIAVALFFVYIAYQSGNIGQRMNGYLIQAKFNEIGGISVGSDVRVGGVKIGTVTQQNIDPKTYQVILSFDIKKDIKLPTDSSAAVVSDGLLGGKYIALMPGADDEMLQNNGTIEVTQDSINLESLIGKFAFGSVNDSKKTDNKSSNNPENNNVEKE